MDSITSQPISPIPPDNLKRGLKIASPDTDPNLPHIGLVGNAYFLLFSSMGVP